MDKPIPVESASAWIDERTKELGYPAGLFNSSLSGNVRRAVDIHEANLANEAALKDLIRAAVALNLMGKSKPKSQ